MKFSIWLNRMMQSGQDGPLYILRHTGYNFQTKIVFVSSRIDFILANSAHHDEMPQCAAFYLGLHCLPKYLFRGFPSTKG